MGIFDKKPLTPNPNQPKDTHSIFRSSQEFIKGSGGLEEKLTRVLRDNPNKLYELNQKLYNAGLPNKFYHQDIPNLAKRLIERRFSSRVTADNKITLQELNSSSEKIAEMREDQKRRTSSTPAFKEDQIMDEFFDNLMK